MVNESRDTIKRHGPCGAILDVNISKKLIRHRGLHSKDTIKINLILADPGSGEGRKLIIIVSKMPDIQRLSVGRAHFTCNMIRLIAIIGPSFLITEHLIILSITLSIDLLVLHGLFTNVCKDRPVIIKAILTRPETVKALLVSMIVAGNHNTENKTMLGKGLNKIRMRIRSLRHSDNSTLRSRSAGASTRLLHNLVNINRHTITAEILRTLEPGIRGSNTEVRL